uniref:Uncharacterized protein n=1 Tax=Arundo donax TaxID=35708 RepID=A0A0A9AYB2_ARUDO
MHKLLFAFTRRLLFCNNQLSFTTIRASFKCFRSWDIT